MELLLIRKQHGNKAAKIHASGYWEKEMQEKVSFPQQEFVKAKKKIGFV